MYRTRKLVAFMFIGTMLPGGTPLASPAEPAYPQRAIHIVVGFPAGGGADALARLLARHMETALGQKVLIENRPGASGNIAAESVAQATPDGYTLYISTRSNTIHKSVYGHFDFDFASDLLPVGLVATVPNVLVTGTQAPIFGVKDMIALAKAHPGALTCASTGFGSDTHLLCELFQRASHTSLLHVPYRGGTVAIADVIGGRVDVLAFSLPGALPYMKAGSVRAIAIMARQRAPAIAHVPTMEEAGIPGVDMETWFGLMAPAGTPPQVIARLNECLNTLLMDAGLQEAFMARGFVAPLGPNTPHTFRDLIRAEIDTWTRILAETGIQATQ
jgi:tripartite-type tricarboxylate transporter receptor subunit TctC